MAELPLVSLGVLTQVSVPGFRVIDPTPNASGARYIVIRDDSLVNYSVPIAPFIKQGIIADTWFSLSDAVPVPPSGTRVVITQAESGGSTPIEYLLIFGGYTRDRRVTVTIDRLF